MVQLARGRDERKSRRLIHWSGTEIKFLLWITDGGEGEGEFGAEALGSESRFGRYLLVSLGHKSGHDELLQNRLFYHQARYG